RVPADADARHPAGVRWAMRPWLATLRRSVDPAGHPHRRFWEASLTALLALATWPPAARADGGTLRLWERAGNYQVSVFTAPAPFRAGPVDVSVFVQDAATGRHVPEARVSVRLTARTGPGLTLDYEATPGAATNKLFHAAHFDLPAPGRWGVEVRVEGP